MRRGKLRVVDRLWKKAMGGGDRERVAKLNYGDFTMRCDLNQLLQRQFYFFGTYFQEEENLECWQESARNADVIFDVGASMGIYSLAALAANPSARVYPFEPTPAIAARLRETADRNGLRRLMVQEVAVARETGEAVLNIWENEETPNEGMNFVTQAPVANCTRSIQIITLDDFCSRERIETIDLLKIDIQGNEPEALWGAERLLSEKRINRIFTELNWTGGDAVSSPAADTIEILRAAGFVFAPPQVAASPKVAGEWLRSLSDLVAIGPGA